MHKPPRRSAVLSVAEQREARRDARRSSLNNALKEKMEMEMLDRKKLARGECRARRARR